MDEDDPDLEEITIAIHRSYEFSRHWLDEMKTETGMKVHYLKGLRAYDPLVGTVYNADGVGRLETDVIKRLCVY